MSGIPEIIIDGVAGMLARPGDPASLRDALTRIVESDTAGISSSGRELVAREFDRSTTMTQLGTLLRGRSASLRHA